MTPLAALLMLTVAEPAPAATCIGVPFATLSKVLAQRYRESPQRMGVTRQGAMMLEFASDEGRTWTVVLVQPGGKVACVLAAGTSLEDVGELPGEPS